MNKDSKLYCNWANRGLALHNNGGALLCCQSREFLKDNNGGKIAWHTHTLDDAWASPTRKEIQLALDQGIQHPNCNACWDEENAGGTSRRQWQNDMDITYDDIPDVPVLLDLKLGNICNLSCRTCNPYVSSHWYRDWWEVIEKDQNNFKTFDQYVGHINLPSKLSYSPDNDQFWNRFLEWLPHAQYIDIYGGEPMLVHRLFDVLQHSIDLGYNKHQTLHFNTNCTIWNQAYIDILSQFKEVYIDLSIDGLYQQYDYMRHGETWDVVVANMDRYYEYLLQYPLHAVCICITVSNLNVYYIDEIWEYFKSKNVNIHYNIAPRPFHINLKTIPATVRQQVTEKLLNNKDSKKDERYLQAVQPVIDFMNTVADSQEEKTGWKDFIRITRELDIRRKQSFATTFPEYYQLLKGFIVTESHS